MLGGGTPQAIKAARKAKARSMASCMALAVLPFRSGARVISGSEVVVLLQTGCKALWAAAEMAALPGANVMRTIGGVGGGAGLGCEGGSTASLGGVTVIGAT